ncbi:MAG: putative PEP-binding protein, partial [Pseudomonadota bacterium]|nr:putative PEP-binding protein [Pseudomonadota bacterium]
GRSSEGCGSSQMRSIQAIPYVPGIARGVLRFGAANATAHSLTLVRGAEIASLTARPAGILAVDAAPLSHVMIRLLNAGIPTLILGSDQAAQLREGDEALLDGVRGVVGDPAEVLAQTEDPPHPPRSGVPVTTLDGVTVSLRASIAGAQGAALALSSGASAIGLVRSEYLDPPDGELPDVGFYEHAFDGLCRTAAPLAVTVRLLDAAGDKRPAWLPDLPGVLTALGLQGSRLYDREPVRSVMLAQIEALGRLAPEHPLSVLVPFVTRTQEFLRWRETILGVLPSPLPVGAMAETPAAVLELAELADAADFVAIGCNDLLQCLFAADRDLSAVAHLVDPYAPAVYRFLRLAARAAGTRLGRVQLCGLLPQLPGVLPILVGLGFSAFSVEPLLIPWLARTLETLDTASAALIAEGVCAARDADAARRLLGLPPGAPWALGASAGV